MHSSLSMKGAQDYDHGEDMCCFIFNSYFPEQLRTSLGKMSINWMIVIYFPELRNTIIQHHIFWVFLTKSLNIKLNVK